MKSRMLLSLLLLLVLAAGAATAMKISPGEALAAGTPSPEATVSTPTTASATAVATGAPVSSSTAVTSTTAVTTTATSIQTGTAFATINLEAGIPLDPFIISLQAGGPVDASTLAPNCKGYIPAAPSVSFTFKASPDLLKGFFYSDGDTVLVVQTPDGKYQCDDNTNPMLLDPSVQIDSPQPGRYNVWVGSAAPKDLIAGMLVLTTKPGVNVGNFRLGDLIKRPAIPETLPTAPVDPANRQKLEQGMTRLLARLPTFQAGDQPITQTVTAEGQLEAVQYMNGDLSCNGYIRLLPNYAFSFKGQTKGLHILFEGNHDATLIVRMPDGTFSCNDDSAKGNLNPQVDVANPKEGTYAIWVGRTKTEVPVTGTLTITDAANAKLPVLTNR
jgi:hypothetical protein